MENKKDDRYYAKKIIGDINAIVSYAKRVDFSKPEQNAQAIDAINFRLIQIRESLAGFSPEFLLAHPAIDVDGIVSFRNQVTHDYGNVDFSFYKKLIEKDLVKIQSQLLAYLN
jgi:uncharacterized protein with HEPN domain